MVTNGKWTDEQIVEWVTIIAIFLFACFPYEMIELSETSLGKLFFIFIILYYAMVDPVYGIIACSIVIVYYNLDLYKSIVAIHRDTLLSENMTVMQNEMNRDLEDNDTIKSEDENDSMKSDIGKVFESYAPGESSIFSYISHSDPVNYNESILLKGSKKKELLDIFRKEYCDAKGQLKYKGGIVQPEMADHVFREIQFPSDSAKCNPCDETCEFSIIEERLNQEEGLRSVSSKDEPIDWNKFFGHYVVTPMRSIADDFASYSEKFSDLISPLSSSSSYSE